MLLLVTLGSHVLAVVGGLVVSQLLTLHITPVIYMEPFIGSGRKARHRKSAPLVAEPQPALH
jgi:Cu/Ag efflux pump CusA